MIENNLTKMSDKLFALLPQQWEQVILLSEIEDQHYSVFFYVKLGGKYIQCYNLESVCGTTEEEIDDFAEVWYNAVLPDRDAENWTYCTAVINADLSFSVDYSYEEEFDLFVWKEKYLI